ncbi:MAG: dynamin family protein [Cyanobacteria bacterium J06597_16]
MNSAIVDPTLQGYKSAIAQLLTRLESFALAIKNPKLTKTVQNLQENINQPFLFVVIGEVKAGKSSFINALLGSGEICEVGADPRTNMVAKIVYAEGDGYSREVKPGELREMGRPVPILEQVAIVDTPGTNSPNQQHEDITKDFIPNSDLVIFVFFSKNPYTNTAWSLVDFAQRDWKKPVIFVLQQADLADERELDSSFRYIQQEAQQRQIPDPKVFATSAKQAINGEDGGFAPIQDFVRDTITGGKGYQLKLTSNIGAAEQIVARLGRDMQLLEQQLKKDEAVVAKIKQRLGKGREQSTYEIDSLVDRLMAQYERIIYRLKGEFRDGLSIFVLAKRSLLSTFSRKQRIETWVNDMKARAQKELEDTLDDTSKDGAKRFLDGVQLLIKQLGNELTTLQDEGLRSTEISLPIVEYRYEVIEGVKERIYNLLDDDTFIHSLADTADDMDPRVVGGGLVSVISGIIAVVTRGLFLDILGGLFFGFGLLFAGGLLFVKRRSLIDKMDAELAKNRDTFEATVSEQLNTKLSVIYEDIDRSFADLYAYVRDERISIVPLAEKFEGIQQTTQTLSHEIKQL